MFAAVGLGVIGAMHIGKVPPAMPAIREDLGLGLVGGGFVVSLFNLLGMVLGLLIGSMTDRLGTQRATMLGLLFLVAGGVLGALASDLSLLLISRALEGVGYIAVVVTMPGIVAGAAGEQSRSFAMGLWSAFMPLGFALGVLGTSVIIPVGGWPIAWLGLAGMTSLGFYVVIRVLPKDAKTPLENSMAQLRMIVARPRLWGLSGAFAAYAFQWVTFMVWLPTYLIEELAFTLGAASLATVGVVVINVPGNLLGGVLLNRGVGPAWIVAGSAISMSLAAAALFLGCVGSPWLVLLCCFAFSFSGGVVPAVLFTGVTYNVDRPGLAGKANGMLMQGSAIGQFIGPPLVGAAVAAAGGQWSGAVAPLGIAAVITTLLCTVAANRPRN
ncbi:MFS transporter [Actibacterium pelagium]|uniref:MFS transporter n=1 Tax=Actibacterium pelagium TaxID=2029103 RepID=UPI0013046B7C|nr:MFS transporter [Actibacterium pelagium]